MEKKLLLLDGLSLLARAFYALPLLTTKAGIATNGILGFLNMYMKFLEEETPQFVAVAFDMPKPTFRHEKFADYKGTRKGMPPELVAQIPLLKEVLGAMGICVIGIEGLEADDILGSLANKAEGEGFVVTIVSGDRDLLQCATENTKISIPKTKGGQTTTENYFAADVAEKLGVLPIEYIEVKALMGDSSDNIPGVSGIGEKTAVKIIQQYGNIENAIAHAAEIKPKRASENLVAEADLARLSKELATIIVNHDIDIKLEDFAMPNIYNPAAIEKFRELELKSMLKKAVTSSEMPVDNKSEDGQLELFSGLAGDSAQLPLYENPLELIDSLKGEIVAYSLSGDGLFVSNHNTYRLGMQEEALKAFFEDESIQKIAFDSKKDMHFLAKKDIDFLGLYFDVLIGGYLLGDLKEGISTQDAALHYLGKSNREPAENIWAIYPIIEQELKARNLFDLYKNIEHPLLFVLFDMERSGVCCNREFISEFGQIMDADIERCSKEVYALAGESFNINSPKQVGEILFGKLGLKGGKKTKTGYSTTAEILQKLAREHEICGKILEFRSYSKLRSTYVEGLLAALQQDGRIHTTFSQVTTATGRLSSIEPNLQNIPIRTELGRQLRRAFVAAEGHVFVDADYSQIELRVLAQLSGDQTFLEAFRRNEDIHRITAARVFGVDLELVSSTQRSYAKAVNFGIVYGISAFSLSEDIKVSVKEAEKFIENYFATYPGVKAYLDESVRRAKEVGYAETLFGRRRAIPELAASNFITRQFGERVAMNMPVQGTAADIIKIAMIRVYKRLRDENLPARLILQIHDELLVEAAEDCAERVKEILLEEMGSIGDLDIPLAVDIEIGKSWFDTK